MAKKIKNKKKPQRKLGGIGGWLILLLIGLIVSILSFGFYSLFFFLSFLVVLIYGLSSELLLRSFSLFFAFGMFLFLDILCLVLMLKKKRSFAKWMTINIWYSFIVSATYLLITETGSLVYLIFADAKSIISIAFGGAIAVLWTMYLRESKRVKNTFVK